jgi:hypothetical protein
MCSAVFLGYLRALSFLTANLFHAEFYLAQTYILCNYGDSDIIFDDKMGNVSLLSRLQMHSIP